MGLPGSRSCWGSPRGGQQWREAGGRSAARRAVAQAEQPQILIESEGNMATWPLWARQEVRGFSSRGGLGLPAQNGARMKLAELQWAAGWREVSVTHRGAESARLSVPLRPVQPPGSPRLLQPSAGSSPRSSESLLDRLSGCVKACELHPCSGQCLKDRPGVTPSAFRFIPAANGVVPAPSRVPPGCGEHRGQPKLGGLLLLYTLRPDFHHPKETQGCSAAGDGRR